MPVSIRAPGSMGWPARFLLQSAPYQPSWHLQKPRMHSPCPLHCEAQRGGWAGSAPVPELHCTAAQLLAATSGARRADRAPAAHCGQCCCTRPSMGKQRCQVYAWLRQNISEGMSHSSPRVPSRGQLHLQCSEVPRLNVCAPPAALHGTAQRKLQHRAHQCHPRVPRRRLVGVAPALGPVHVCILPVAPGHFVAQGVLLDLAVVRRYAAHVPRVEGRLVALAPKLGPHVAPAGAVHVVAVACTRRQAWRVSLGRAGCLLGCMSSLKLCWCVARQAAATLPAHLRTGRASTRAPSC
jgi:hypothetical protein